MAKCRISPNNVLEADILRAGEKVQVEGICWSLLSKRA